MSVASIDPVSDWHPWNVAQESGFEVRGPSGEVGLVQLSEKKFAVTVPFRFSNPSVEQALIKRMVRNGVSDADAAASMERARTFTPRKDNPTDLASVPQFMRWFVSSYGRHTLAAILHDELIEKEANAGELHSDTLSDRFFREMLGAAGVKWLKRWIMWAAVALRTRWAAGGWRRASVMVWLALALTGIVAFVAAVGTAWPGWDPPIATPVLWIVAVLLPFAAAGLWGKQYGAGIVAATAGLWILPAAVFAGVGYLVYWLLEEGFHAVGVD